MKFVLRRQRPDGQLDLGGAYSANHRWAACAGPLAAESRRADSVATSAIVQPALLGAGPAGRPAAHTPRELSGVC
jgi:hypothetical protein